MKLAIELIPHTAWHNNMRSLMGKKAWDILRKKIYKAFNNHCGICGTSGKLDCHEIWKFDDMNHTQTLVGFIALCDLCHSVKHIGFSSLRKNMDLLEKHFMKVNKCDYQAFLRHKQEAFKQFDNRSKFSWQLNIGSYKDVSRIL